MGAAPAEHAGVASAVNNVVARAAGLLAVAVLPVVAGLTGSDSLSRRGFDQGFRVAVSIAGATCVAGGILAAAVIRDPEGSGHLGAGEPCRWHCALDAVPLNPQPDAPR